MPHQVPGLKLKHRFQSTNIFQGFSNAFRGIVAVARSERNFRIHLLMSLGVLVVASVCGVSPAEWLVLLLLIALVLAFEAMNTAIEYLVDLLTGGEYSKVGGTIKDMSAGACLILAICAVIIGLVIFVPYFLVLVVNTAPKIR